MTARFNPVDEMIGEVNQDFDNQVKLVVVVEDDKAAYSSLKQKEHLFEKSPEQ